LTLIKYYEKIHTLYVTDLYNCDTDILKQLTDIEISKDKYKFVKQINASYSNKLTNINNLQKLEILDAFESSCIYDQTTHLIKLKISTTEMCKINDNGIKNLKNLKYLNASNNPNITNINHLVNLETLYATESCGIGDTGITQLFIPCKDGSVYTKIKYIKSQYNNKITKSLLKYII
jgi:hypothetical protein